MPIYDFECEECGSRFEELVPVGEIPDACPKCGSARVLRIFSAPAPPANFGTPGERRRRDDQRGIDRGGAKERFGEQLKRERSPRDEGSR